MLAQVLKNPKVDTVFMTHWQGANWARKAKLDMFKKIQGLPATLGDDKFHETTEFKYEGGEFRIDLSVPVHRRKNILNQILAAQGVGKMIGPKLTEEYEEYRHLIDERPWQDPLQYRTHLRSCQVSMQVTWTESFNYAFAERVMMGLPTLTNMQTMSNHLPDHRVRKVNGLDQKHMHEYRTDWLRWFCIQNPDNPGEIYHKLRQIRDNYEEATEKWRAFKQAAKVRYAQNNLIAQRVMREWAE
jgi:hypothetical protein